MDSSMRTTTIMSCILKFVNRLAEILQHNLPEDQAENAQRLAHKYAENEREAVGKVDEILARNKVDID